MHDTPGNHFEDLMIPNSGFVPSFYFENVWARKELYSRMGLNVHICRLWEDHLDPK